MQGDHLLGFIWRQRDYLRKFMIWRVISVLLITPFPIITQRIVDVAIPQHDAESVLMYTLISLGLLAAHFVTRRLAVVSLSLMNCSNFDCLTVRS